MKEIRTRFAPSPTGFLHIGGVRTALFNYLFAKKRGGKFILRLEDTDRERFVADGVGQIVEAMDWLGLKPDEGFWISEGKHQQIEYVQSERHKKGIYRNAASQLIKEGLAYYSPTSPKELEAMRERAKEQKRAFLYRRDFDPKNTNNQLENCPVRLDIDTVKKLKPNLQDVRWTEGNENNYVIEDINKIEDFIILKSDGFPSYNFANVIDDHLMKITHVLRGNEFIASTPKHALLYTLFGLQPPIFIHLSVINGTDGKKLSKRTGDTDVLEYRKKGYLPEGLLNFLALLGWNDGTEQEIFSLDEFARKFDLSQINKSPATFDQQRLDWINGVHIRKLPLDDLYKRAKDFWPPEAGSFDDEYKKQVLGLVQERLKYFAELPELTIFFFKDLPVNLKLIEENKQLKKLENSEIKGLLKKATEKLSGCDFSATALNDYLNQLLEETSQKPAILFSLIRIATTQAPASPGLADTLAVLGKEKSLKRIEETLEKL